MTGIRVLTEELGILMIMDEVKTGFRVTLGGAQEYLNARIINHSFVPIMIKWQVLTMLV